MAVGGFSRWRARVRQGPTRACVSAIVARMKSTRVRVRGASTMYYSRWLYRSCMRFRALESLSSQVREARRAVPYDLSEVTAKTIRLSGQYRLGREVVDRRTRSVRAAIGPSRWSAVLR